MNPALLLNPKAALAAKKMKPANDAPKPPSTPPRSKKTLDNLDSSPIKTPSYNPSTLLNPKLASGKAAMDPHHKDIQNNSTSAQVDDIANGNIFGSLIEKHHGVTRREAAAPKRFRATEEDTDDQDSFDQNKKRAKVDRGSKGGIIGQSVQQMRQQAQDEKGVPDSVVDLTGDDDVTLVASTMNSGLDPNREVCIGTILAKIHAHKVPVASSRALANVEGVWPPSVCSIRRVPGQLFALDALDKSGHHFGKVDTVTSMALTTILQGYGVHKARCNAWLTSRRRKPHEQTGDHISELLNVHITLFCAFQHAEGIRRVLSQKNVHLMKPTAHTENKEICVPEPKSFAPKNPAAAAALRYGTVSHTARSEQEIKQDVQNIIDNLPSTDGLPHKEADDSIVLTRLLDHQKQALYWLSKMETPVTEDDAEEATDSLWKMQFKDGGAKYWYNIISGAEARSIPQCLGGLFSDEMGLGKTLSILATIVNFLPEAVEFGQKEPKVSAQEYPNIEMTTRATLIVCPKGVLNNWDEQIRAHLDNKKISFYAYHGSKREQDLDVLANHDIIITSFSMVESESRARHKPNFKYGALTKLNYFRIVLDEAHMIRNITTSAFTGCCALASDRRWAVTGTPVQNRLDDLGALIKFVKVPPFYEKGQWEQQFTAAWKSGNEQVLPNLKALVSSLMLRRNKKKINIEDPDNITVRLTMSEEERGLYEAFAKDSYGKMNALTDSNGRLKGSGTAHMLTFITRLRLICCHGKDLLSDDDMKLLDGQSYETAISLDDDEDERPIMTERQIYDSFLMMRTSSVNRCCYCNHEIDSQPSEEDDEDEDSAGADDEDSPPNEASSAPQTIDQDKDTIGYMTPCLHMICRTHVNQYLAGLAKNKTTDNYASCPVCEQYIRSSLSRLTRAGIEAEETRRDALRAGPRHKPKSAPYTGPHTKVRALLAHLAATAAESAPLTAAGQPPLRSVVFSGWTQYLDLISVALADAGVAHLRLDGTMHVRARAAVLARFRTDADVAVLLVSIRAGGQGLNLTAASRVYMMEPQFNPGVEMQAVDRVHRIGQDRKVKVVKFLMADSFEGKIVKLQEQKLSLAREAFGEGGKGNERERMEGLRSLFR